MFTDYFTRIMKSKFPATNLNMVLSVLALGAYAGAMAVPIYAFALWCDTAQVPRLLFATGIGLGVLALIFTLCATDKQIIKFALLPFVFACVAELALALGTVGVACFFGANAIFRLHLPAMYLASVIFPPWSRSSMNRGVVFVAGMEWLFFFACILLIRWHLQKRRNLKQMSESFSS